MSLRTLTCALLALAPSLALAADHEFSAEFGILQGANSHPDVFGGGDYSPSWGFRGGVKVHDRVALIATYHHTEAGTSVWGGETYAFHGAHFSNQFTLGAKADLEITPWFQPYLTLQGMVLHQQWMLDDAPNDRNEAGQLRRDPTTGGGVATGGFEFRLPKGSAPVTFGLYHEAGYALLANTPGNDIDPDGARAGGFVFRTGLGARF